MLRWYNETRDIAEQEEQPDDYVIENSLFVNFYRRKLNEIIAYDKEETSIDNEDKKLMEDSTSQYETYVE